jgi:hypothetical protein
MMRISLERQGGVTGIPIAITIDSSTLPPEQAAQLHRLVSAARFFDLPAHLPASPQPDRFQYRLTIEDNHLRHTVTLSETALSDTLRPLVNWLMAWGRSG